MEESYVWPMRRISRYGSVSKSVWDCHWDVQWHLTAVCGVSPTNSGHEVMDDLIRLLFVCVSSCRLGEFCCRMTLARARTGICSGASPAEIGNRGQALPGAQAKINSTYRPHRLRYLVHGRSICTTSNDVNIYMVVVPRHGVTMIL